MPTPRYIPTPKKCEVCGLEWTPGNATQARRNKVCSRQCANRLIGAANSGKKKPDPICLNCGKAFRPKSRRTLSKAKHCSAKCAVETRMKDPSYVARLKAIAVLGHEGWTATGRANYRRKMTGSLNPAWKGGATYKRPKGNYIGPKYVRCPVDLTSMARSDGYVMEHRMVMAHMAGRVLDRVEVVHHRDHLPRNNVPTNLELWPDNGTHKAAEHGRYVINAANRWCQRALGQP